MAEHVEGDLPPRAPFPEETPSPRARLFAYAAASSIRRSSGGGGQQLQRRRVWEWIRAAGVSCAEILFLWRCWFQCCRGECMCNFFFVLYWLRRSEWGQTFVCEELVSGAGGEGFRE